MPDTPAFNNGQTAVAMAHQDRAQREEIKRLQALYQESVASRVQLVIEIQRLRTITDDMVECAARALAREVGEEFVFEQDIDPIVCAGYRESARKALVAAFQQEPSDA